MLDRKPFGLTTGPIEGAEILVAGCRKETVASEMRSNVLKYRDTLVNYLSICTPVMPHINCCIGSGSCLLKSTHVILIFTRFCGDPEEGI
jgi:hypothetical protein